ncbi:MAG: CheR family methyltransferase [Coleofasciculaceae cyanobacterium]
MPDKYSLSSVLQQRFVELIVSYLGLEIRDRDQYYLKEKIFLRMKNLGLSDPKDYYQILASMNKKSHQEWLEFAILITNVESYFFRDKGQFNLLRSYLLPEIIKRQQDKKTIRICSAGCSSGEEIYSIAILIKELIADLEAWDLTLLGVDINQAALQKAKTGIYSPWSFRNIKEKTKEQYFQLVNNQYHIDQKIKEMTKFQNLNLVKDSFLHPDFQLREMDLILCRNVFIYFDQKSVDKVMEKFYHALQPGGYFLTGHAELYGHNLNHFQTQIFTESLIYQRLANDSLVKKSAQSLTNEYNHNLAEQFSGLINQTAAEGSYLKMQQVSLNLLKQLPPDTTIPRLGNLTAAQLISQLEESLKVSEE